MADAIRRYKSSIKARLRGKISIALKTALSARVLKYQTTAFGGLAVGTQAQLWNSYGVSTEQWVVTQGVLFTYSG